LSIVFLISDFQSDSYKIGLLKHAILSIYKDIDIIDITHNIRLNNTIEASFVARQLQLTDNQGDIVVIRVGKPKKTIVYQHLLNLYILPDNGLLTMLFDHPDLKNVYYADNHHEAQIIALFKNGQLDTLKPAGNSMVISYNKQLNIQGDFIICEVVYSDKHGNCYFNLTKERFEGFVNGKKYNFRIQHYTGQVFSEVGKSVNDVNPGDALLTFSRSGYLKLQINLGNAKQLFRIKDDTKIILETA
jgi:S-adenosyl-L-methionine hydrolase (adenosine-forming)